MSDFIFYTIVTFLIMTGIMLLHGFVTNTFDNVVLNFGAVLTTYKAPMIVSFVFSTLFAWVKVSA